MTFDQCKSKAVKNVAALDKIDGYKDRASGTILAALECGLKRPETNAQFDALVMLEDVRKTFLSQMYPCHHCGGQHPIGGPNPCHKRIEDSCSKTANTR